MIAREFDPIPGFLGEQYQSVHVNYNAVNRQYASSTHQIDHDMNPGLILQPNGTQDVQVAVRWAKDNGCAIAVKSGGHQYSGASSTSQQNIQLDLTLAFPEMSPADDVPVSSPHRRMVKIGVSNSLLSFNTFLRGHQLFVPHGQCQSVHIGGHAQTGGYGQLGRSFGLFGDHIRQIELVDHDAALRTITKETEPDLFNAILGGSPGNFGIVLHYWVEAHKDEELPGPVQGLKGIWVYNPEVFKRGLAEVAKIASDPDFPRNYDLCVSVLSPSLQLEGYIPDAQRQPAWDNLKRHFGSRLKPKVWPAAIMVYAQWTPIEVDDKPDATVRAWFDKLDNLGAKFLRIYSNRSPAPMSEMTSRWIFTFNREFNLPYDKRAYSTNSFNLGSEWVNKVADQVTAVIHHRQPRNDLSLDESPVTRPEEIPDPVLSDEADADQATLRASSEDGIGDGIVELFGVKYVGCKVCVQIQAFGGNNSQIAANANNGTSYSWRDTTVVAVLDCFHQPDAKARAADWQAINDQMMIGPDSLFSETDRRFLWGSYGDWDMKNTWQYYYDDQDLYRRIGRARAKYDPDGTFTPNPFAVEPVID